MTETSSEQSESPGPQPETPEVANAHPLSRFFFLKTTFGLLFTFLLIAGGFFAYSNLTKEALPDLDIPNATITTLWAGADPQTIEEQVTQVLEDEIATLKGLKTFSSASFDSYSIIAVEFTADTDTDDAMQRLRDAVSDATGDLPDKAEAPDIQQVSVNDQPIMTVTLFGDASDADLNALARELQDRVETIGGVNEVELGGAREEVIQILLDPERLLSLSIAPTQVSQAVATANLDQPFGDIESDEVGAVFRLEGQFQDVSDFEALPIAKLGGEIEQRHVRLGELGSVSRQLEREEARAYFSEAAGPYQKTVEISVKKAPGADTVKLIEQISAELAVWSEANDWPDGIKYTITQNEADKILASLSDVFENGLQAMVIVFVILFLILSWREGLIAGLSIPLSFCGALIVIWMLGYTLNELVIIGMVLSLGLLVDVIILMMEGVHDEIYSKHKTFGQAALATIHKYAVPAFAGQLTTILALAPLMAISGASGKFIRVLPVTAITCLVAAFVVALLATVPLSRYLLAPVAKKGAATKETGADRIMGRISAALETWSLRVSLKSKTRASVFVVGALSLFGLSLFSVTRIPVVLYPSTDGLNLGINIELPPSTTLDTSESVADTVGEILREKPYFDSIIKLVGRKSPFASTSILSSLEQSQSEQFIGFSITFKERSERDKPSYQLADEIRRELKAYLDANVAGASLLVVPEIRSPSTGDPVQIAITGNELETLQRLSSEVQGLLTEIPGTTDVRDNLGSVKTEITLSPNREAADFFGLTQQDIAAQIRFAVSNDPIGVFTTVGPEDDLDILLSLNWASRGGSVGGPTSLEELSTIRAFTPGGGTVSLLSILEPEVSEAPMSVIHRDGDRAITVMSKLDGRTVDEVVSDIEPRLEELSAAWPTGYAWSIGGESEETAETFGSAGIMLIVALIMVYGVLVIVFGSFSQGVILMTTMPLALVGTFIGFWLSGMSLSFFAMIGIISLIGIVANNGIIMVDTMNTELQGGKSIAQAAANGAGARLRPILTTSITTVAGLLPLAIGSPMYAPLCYAIIFGLVASTLLSLIIVPCLYVLLTGENQRAAENLD
ncbi:efflux RND transporter permease subunit [Henriciella aquimarina]|uniref:efflux RND transporter permease subunit n=1 Tax=Henriciella aquimarina TaxID=545261 RepID=UPI000A01DAD5|nr:efflux RND transporter permease subunit [Henriciella aquimarina]